MSEENPDRTELREVIVTVQQEKVAEKWAERWLSKNAPGHNFYTSQIFLAGFYIALASRGRIGIDNSNRISKVPTLVSYMLWQVLEDANNLQASSKISKSESAPGILESASSEHASRNEAERDNVELVLSPNLLSYSLIDSFEVMKESGTDEHTRSLGVKYLVAFTAFLESGEALYIQDACKKVFSVNGNISVEAGESIDLFEGPRALPRSLGDVREELDSLVGLSEVKSTLLREEAVQLYGIERSSRGMPVGKPTRHMIFTGNPGTGKTTVARIVASMYADAGILSKGHLVEVGPAGLMSRYLGQNTENALRIVESALGGVLLVDEAYSLAGVEGQVHLFAKEVIDVLVKALEDYREDLVVIFTGYKGPMEEFVATNPGLESRISKTLHFPDYSNEELVEVFMRYAATEKMEVEPGAIELLMARLKTVPRTDRFGNARLVRTLYGETVAGAALRLKDNFAGASDEDLALITLRDVELALAGLPSPVASTFGFTTSAETAASGL